MSSESRLGFEELEDGSIWLVTLRGSKGNIIDSPMIEALSEVAIRAADSDMLKAIVFTGAEGHFSYGASVQEHRPGEIDAMLPAFHELFRRFFEAGVFTVAAVEGNCLGGGLELAAFCNRIVSSTDARFGQPEIKLGVFAPVGSVFLPARIQRNKAEELCITGHVISAAEALEISLVDELAESPVEAAVDYVRQHFTGLSASSLRFAVRASRLALSQHYDRVIRDLERLYLDQLMATEDAREGVEAFLEKREPEWRNC